MSLNPQITDQGSKVKMTWTPDLSGQGYRFYVDGVAVSRTFKPDANTTTFNKPDSNPHEYGIQKMDVIAPLEEVLFPAPPDPEPEPSEKYPFGLPTLRPGFVTREPAANANSVSVPAGVDGLVDCKKLVHTGGTMEVFGSSGSVIRVTGYRANINTAMSNSPYWRGGIGLKGDATFWVDDYCVIGSTLADNLKLNLGLNGKLYFQHARCESASQSRAGFDTPEPAEHCDAFQVQGPVKELYFGNIVMYAASVSTPSNHGGKCFQIDHEPSSTRPDGSIEKVVFKQVQMRGQGNRTGTFLGMFAGNCTFSLEDVWCWKEGTGIYTWGNGNTGLFWPNGSNSWVSSGTAPNRFADFTASYITGGVREGIASWEAALSRASFGM